MKKQELIRLMSAQSGVTQRQVASVLTALPGVVAEIVERGGKVKLAGLGTFSLVLRQARQGRNPQTGEPVKIPARFILRFAAERKWKKVVVPENLRP